MKKILLILMCFAFVRAFTAQAQLQDWKNAPLNPLSEYARNHISSNAGLKGSVAVVGNKWYDVNGAEIKENVFNDINEAAKYAGVYYVTKDGNVMNKNSYYNGKASITFYTYDKNGRVLTINEDLKKFYTFTYDVKGRVIKEINKGDNYEYTTNYTYKVSGNDLIINEKQYNLEKVLVNEFTYTYSDGLLMKWQEGTIETKVFKYEFDKQGSWIKRFVNDSPDSGRTILYRDQIQNLPDSKLFITKGNYTPMVTARLGLIDVPFLKGKVKQFTYFYNPVDKQYLMYETNVVSLKNEDIGKEVQVTKKDKGEIYIRFTNGTVAAVNGKTL